MKLSLPELNSTNSTVLIHAVEKNLFKEPSKVSIENRSNFQIAFIGTMYARENWDCLFAALDSLNWQLKGKPVEILIMASTVEFFNIKSSINVRILGYRSIADQLDAISCANVAYLPYWFRPENEDSARYSHPNKLSIYLAACLPVLFHGPCYSSIPSTDTLNGIGPICYSLDPNELASCLSKFTEESVERFIKHIVHLREQEFTAHIFRERFTSMIQQALNSHIQ
jgi:hypothetical protein